MRPLAGQIVTRAATAVHQPAECASGATSGVVQQSDRSRQRPSRDGLERLDGMARSGPGFARPLDRQADWMAVRWLGDSSTTMSSPGMVAGICYRTRSAVSVPWASGIRARPPRRRAWSTTPLAGSPAVPPASPGPCRELRPRLPLRPALQDPDDLQKCFLSRWRCAKPPRNGSG